jgi:hypothetical protein
LVNCEVNEKLYSVCTTEGFGVLEELPPQPFKNIIVASVKIK